MEELENGKSTYAVLQVLLGSVSLFLVGQMLKKIYLSSTDTTQPESPLSNLNKYELTIASHLIDPSQIDVTYDDIAGLANIKDILDEELILPLQFASAVSSDLYVPPKGVLLYGPPGCGKTMIAKAIAKRTSARFLNLEISTVTDKLHGESEKFCLAVFTLAVKVKPCIIFIDEIDSFLRSRSIADSEVGAMMKSQFLTKWDGFNSRQDNRGVVVLGCTNRREDVDEAVLRRMPVQLEIPLPNLEERKAILTSHLREVPLDDDVDISKIAQMTEGRSASDLADVCRRVVWAPVKEERSRIFGERDNRYAKHLINVNQNDHNNAMAITEYKRRLRKVNQDDFNNSLTSGRGRSSLQIKTRDRSTPALTLGRWGLTQQRRTTEVVVTNSGTQQLINLDKKSIGLLSAACSFIIYVVFSNPWSIIIFAAVLLCFVLEYLKDKFFW